MIGWKKEMWVHAEIGEPTLSLVALDRLCIDRIREEWNPRADTWPNVTEL